LAEEGVEAYPSHAPLSNNLAVLKELAGDLPTRRLVRDARKNEPSLPSSPRIWATWLPRLALRRGLGCLQPGCRARARPRDDVYFKLGNIAYKRNDRDLAAQLWRKALEINPKHELVKANLGHLERVVVTSEPDERAFKALTQQISRRVAGRAAPTRTAACGAYRVRMRRGASTPTTSTAGARDRPHE